MPVHRNNESTMVQIVVESPKSLFIPCTYVVNGDE